MNRQELLDRFRDVRGTSMALAAPLKPEDYRIQSMPDVSPPWWNLGHTSWFFAVNVLKPYGLGNGVDERLDYVLNSYYESVGPRLPRAQRGLVTRPTTEEVLAFRESVDRRVAELLPSLADGDFERVRFLVTTGMHHEQQHQELLLTEIKHILGTNAPELRQAYHAPAAPAAASGPRELRFVTFEGGVREIGNLEGGWCWDNELPVHKAYLADFELADRLVTNREYLEFMEDGGYSRPLLWLSNGWGRVAEEGWQAPLYWERRDGEWHTWTLSGTRPVDPDEPVCHVSLYEADAFARWLSEQGGAGAGARLPTEREWEHAARSAGFSTDGANLLETGTYHPRPAPAGGEGPAQLAGDLWEWTSNHYEPYPGYQPFEGTLMEYNGKFMDNQRVLRGGSCATPASHIRVSYRNFWAPETRFQLTGIRLARDAQG